MRRDASKIRGLLFDFVPMRIMLGMLHAMLVITTVGYGTPTMVTDGAKFWCIFQILIGVLILASIIGDWVHRARKNIRVIWK